MHNIILIGMPGSGKSSLGKKISSILKMSYLDTDDLIVSYVGKPISQIFSDSGEEYFRNAESDVISDLAAKIGERPSVIATGGGAILRDVNAENLRKLGKIVFIHRDIDDIADKDICNDNRPLLRNRDSLLTLWAEREDLYRKAADGVVLNEGEFSTTVNRLIRLIKEWQ